MPRTRTSIGKRSLAPREWGCAKRMIEAVEQGLPKSARQCAIEAGYAESYASQAASKVKGLMSSNEALREVCDKKGLTLESIAEDLVDLRTATKHISLGKGTSKEVPDHNVRLATLRLRTEIHDALPNPRLEIDRTDRIINITIDAGTMERIAHARGPGIRSLSCPTDPALPPSTD